MELNKFSVFLPDHSSFTLPSSHNMKILSIGSDHAGFAYKQKLAETLRNMGYEVKDHGTHSAESMDYPDVAHPVALDLAGGVSALGVLLCGSANGVAITANKHAGVRAAICWNEELASLARQHNDANILCIPARFVDYETALSMLNTFLNTPFEGGRHLHRVQKINR